MITKYILFPYYLTLKIRNAFFDKRVGKSYRSVIPTIGIGNVSVGGTGKTPLTAYIVDYLSKNHKVATLSRGYKSKNKTFHTVSINDSARDVGDEPLMLKNKFPEIIAAVDKNKTRGLQLFEAMPNTTRPDVVVIDDSLQHRKVTPTKTIVAIDYTRPIFSDELLPFGNLRDLPEQIKRADAIVFTKCPSYLDEWEREKAVKTNRIRKETPVFFSTFQYERPLPVFPSLGDGRYIYSKEALLLSGIANPKPLIMELTDKYDKIAHIKYRDHHNFSSADVSQIKHYAKRNLRSVILTTEKDAQRLRTNKYVKKASAILPRLFYLPVAIQFLTPQEEQDFNRFITI